MGLSAFKTMKCPKRAVLAAALAGAVGASVLPASAANIAFYKEVIYADSFGNLIIYSPSGYKRIVVGRGFLADELSQYGAGKPTVIYPDPTDEGTLHKVRHCQEFGVLLHGRSYMYGLPDNVVPVLKSPCY
jgi:hypothetical protein